MKHDRVALAFRVYRTTKELLVRPPVFSFLLLVNITKTKNYRNFASFFKLIVSPKRSHSPLPHTSAFWNMSRDHIHVSLHSTVGGQALLTLPPLAMDW